ncbi:type III polyketide synthase [Virgibacillus byunsanensis]|uniref:Type III polyketide synthase n=1 Tax=Virgibacillus byunsanensis TaxID=570945 RepID=A0ABW3LJR6_9BACI
MAYICSTGVGIPENNLSQQRIKELVKGIFPSNNRLDRLMPVFDNAKVHNRQFVVDQEWFNENHSFQESNNLYQHFAQKYALEAIDHCLGNNQFLSKDIPYEAIDMIIFVSSTGIATPSIDAHLLNKRPFRTDINRMPLWGLGCAGGAIGLSRTFDWIKANSDKMALIICCELCSLTFQKDDVKKSNVIGSALFGDGVGAALVVGENSNFFSYRKKTVPKITATSSLTKKNSTNVMGWEVTHGGLEVIFSKSIPALVNTFWNEHINSFLYENELTEERIHSFIAHPGGKKVLEAMEEVLQSPKQKLSKSYKVLANHGNMSSATVFYVLYEWMNESISKGERSILSALGPGFSSELILMEWT